jgi:hypothetical protein
MAELPYKFTVCPDNPPPKLTTATSSSMLKLLKYTPDLTIRQDIWDMWRGKDVGKNVEEEIANLRDLIEKEKK